MAGFFSWVVLQDILVILVVEVVIELLYKKKVCKRISHVSKTILKQYLKIIKNIYGQKMKVS